VWDQKDPSTLWLGPPGAACHSLAIGDLQGDGQAEVVSESQILSATDGTLLAEYGPVAPGGFATNVGVESGPWYVDVFGNATALTLPDGAYAHTASYRVVVDPTQAQLFVEGSANRPALDLHAQLPLACPLGSAGALASGGPPTIADVDGDGVADIGVATARGYVVFDGSKLQDASEPDSNTYLWSRLTTIVTTANAPAPRSTSTATVGPISSRSTPLISASSDPTASSVRACATPPSRVWPFRW
jgi:hypothetical protein